MGYYQKNLLRIDCYRNINISRFKRFRYKNDNISNDLLSLARHESLKIPYYYRFYDILNNPLKYFSSKQHGPKPLSYHTSVVFSSIENKLSNYKRRNWW